MSSDEVADAERARRRRAADLLGDLLPEGSADDSPRGWGEDPGESAREDELRRDVPPHHGG